MPTDPEPPNYAKLPLLIQSTHSRDFPLVFIMAMTRTKGKGKGEKGYKPANGNFERLNTLIAIECTGSTGNTPYYNLPHSHSPFTIHHSPFTVHASQSLLCKSIVLTTWQGSVLHPLVGQTKSLTLTPDKYSTRLDTTRQ
ncbi:hypothetical protein FRB91_008125 [Serendipita sp. 411]|nr:hypothetical protein FRB91_008125 [Serendipita sp. 411]